MEYPVINVGNVQWKKFYKVAAAVVLTVPAGLVDTVALMVAGEAMENSNRAASIGNRL